MPQGERDHTHIHTRGRARACTSIEKQKQESTTHFEMLDALSVRNFNRAPVSEVQHRLTLECRLCCGAAWGQNQG